MPKRMIATGSKNIIGRRLNQLRLEHDMSQRDLAIKMQTHGYDMDKNVITRIETGKRYVTDIELYAFSTYFKVSCDYLIGLTSEKRPNR